jgi:hypothetical protein
MAQEQVFSPVVDSRATPGCGFFGLSFAVNAQVIPYASQVVRFTVGTLVQGSIGLAKGAHVLSMSMGGLSSKRWSMPSISPMSLDW